MPAKRRFSAGSLLLFISISRRRCFFRRFLIAAYEARHARRMQARKPQMAMKAEHLLAMEYDDIVDFLAE